MITKKEDKRNNPNLGLFATPKGTFENPLDVPLFFDGKETTLLKVLNTISDAQKAIKEDIANLKSVLTKYAEAEKINDTAIASSLDVVSKRLFKLENVGNIWGAK